MTTKTKTPPSPALALAFIIAIGALPMPCAAGAANNNQITFKVTDSDKAPIAGALVTVDGAQQATTGADGTATLGLAQGAGELTIVKGGFFNAMRKLPAGKSRVEIALPKYIPWTRLIINDYDPTQNRITYYPDKFAAKKGGPNWFFNNLGEHEATMFVNGSDNHASYTKGNYMTCDFEGTTIRVFTLRNRNSGKARFSVDGQHEQVVDLYDKAEANSGYEMAYEQRDLPAGKHTLKLEVLGEKNAAAAQAKIYFDFCDTSGYPVFGRFGIGKTVGIISNTTKEVSFAHVLKAPGPGGFNEIEEIGFVAAPVTPGRAPAVNDIRIKAELGAGGKFSATAPASLFQQRVRYAVTPYVVDGGIVYYGEEPVFFTPAPVIRLERTVLGLQAGQGAISTRNIILRDAGGFSDLKWKLVSQGKYDGAPATNIISRAFKDGAVAVKDAPLKVTGLNEGEAVVRCYSESNPDKYADCLVAVAKADRNKRLSGLPLMGWSTWSAYGRGISTANMTQTANDMLKHIPCAGGKSLKDLGYNYFLIDGGWRVNYIAPDGRIIPNYERFGGIEGIKAFSKYLHDNGLKLGFHMIPGWGDCAGQPMGMDGFEKTQFQEYADWQVDYLFADVCYPEKDQRHNRTHETDPEYLQTLYTKFKYYLDNCGRDMVIKATGVLNTKWGYQLVNYFRTGGDISQYINTSEEGRGRWLEPLDRPKPKNTAAFNEARNAGAKWQVSGQGTGLWPDPDQMIFGDPGLNLVEQQSMFNMWSITASPLVLGGIVADLIDEKKGIAQIITNEEVIAVDRDPLGRIGHVLKAYTNNPTYTNRRPDPATAADRPDANLVVYGRPLHDGSWALVLMNNTEQVQNITVKFADLDYDGSIGGKTKLTKGNYTLRNLNTREDMGKFTDQFTCKNLPVHGSVMIKVTPDKLDNKNNN